MGSYLCFLHQTDQSASAESPLGRGLYLRSVDVSRTAPRELLKLELPSDLDLEQSTAAGFPGGVDVSSEDGSTALFCLGRPDEFDSVHFRAQGTALRFRAPISLYVNASPAGENRCAVTSFPANLKMGIETTRGSLKLDAPWGSHQCEYITVELLPDETGRVEGVIECFTSTWSARERWAVDELAASSRAEFDAFASKLPPVAEKALEPVYREAGFVCWSNTVRPRGNFRRPAIVMSKHTMSNVWPWDNCFNAMALCDSHPELAWDQIRVVTDHQDRWGALPDGINPNQVQWTFCKSPVYGYSYRYFLEHNPGFFAEPARLAEGYEIISRLSNWWLNTRRLPDRPLVYMAHGNEGFDTSTMFIEGCPLEGPDVNAYLCDQTDALSTMAEKLGKPDESAAWREVSDDLLENLVSDLWNPELGQFVSRRYDGKEVRCDSSQMLIPIILGKRLPEPVIASLLERVRAFVTPHGLATELPTSPYYEPDGHCRGSIWAPPTFFIGNGCRAVGHAELADEIERKYLAMLSKEGFYECFDALEGTAQRELAYSWTANVFMMFAKSGSTM